MSVFNGMVKENFSIHSWSLSFQFTFPEFVIQEENHQEEILWKYQV